MNVDVEAATASQAHWLSSKASLTEHWRRQRGTALNTTGTSWEIRPYESHMSVQKRASSRCQWQKKWKRWTSPLPWPLAWPATAPRRPRAISSASIQNESFKSNYFMIEQYLLNKNKNATISKSKNFWMEVRNCCTIGTGAVSVNSDRTAVSWYDFTTFGFV